MSVNKQSTICFDKGYLYEDTPFTSVEICAGAGGQALGVEWAGFHPVALVELEKEYCATLKLNRPRWNVINKDVREFDGRGFEGVDLLAGGVPCPPFSSAGKQLGKDDERDLFPEAIRLVSVLRPRAVMLENVRGLLSPMFDEYRTVIRNKLESLGYAVQWKLLNASDYGVPQLRPRVIFVAIKNDIANHFMFPEKEKELLTVGDALYDLMCQRNWKEVDLWREKANAIAPTIVGGSKKHGGPDLGPTRAKAAWAELGVDGKGIANESPEEEFIGMPRLTNRMVARLQGFPDTWQFSGAKTSVYRQIGNAFPPPVACAVAASIKECLKGNDIYNGSIYSEIQARIS